MKLKVLGTQSPYNTPGHNCPGFLITDGDNKILLDCGSGSHSLLNFPDDLNNLSVIISHLHRDHYNDIFNLQYASFVFHNQKRISNPIQIYMPQSPNTISSDIISETNSFAEYKIIDATSQLHIGEMTITFCPTDHPVETYAIKICHGDRTIVYTSDTSYSAKNKLIEFAKDSDLIISESSLLKSYGFPEITSHLTAYQAATIAKNTNTKGLMLTHFWPEESPEKFVEEARNVFPKTINAEEGKILDFQRITEKYIETR